MSSRTYISNKPLTDLYYPMKTLQSGKEQGMCNAGINLVGRHPDGYVCLEKKLPPTLIKNGVAKFEFSTLRRLKHVNIVKYLDALDCMEQARVSTWSIATGVHWRMKLRGG